MCDNESTIHVFEKAELGKAPFRVVGVEERRGPIRIAQPNGIVLEIGSPGQPMGTCDYCGQGIAECWTIKSADGKKFVVGCDCVRRTGDAGLKKVVNKHRNEARKRREDERIAACKQLLADDQDLRDTLDAKPHPNEWRAGKGDTRLDWSEWMLKHSGNAGSMKVVRYIDKLTKETA